MGLQTTMYGDRLQIVLLGKTNAGKSSLINAMTGQSIAIVSDTKGTTTDPVSKAMELLPIGPCLLTDTPGLDDESELGRKRVEKTKEVLHRADVAVLVISITEFIEEKAGLMHLPKLEQDMTDWLKKRNVPIVIVLNQADRISAQQAEQIRHQVQANYPDHAVVSTSALKMQGIEELKDRLIAVAPHEDKELHIVSDLVQPGDMVVLVVPIDSAAPKGRLIMPQQQTIRDLLDHHAIPIVAQVEELASVLDSLRDKVKLVITDSQAFREVNEIVPADIPLTSFSILFARHKGNLQQLMKDVQAVERLQDGDKVLIAEGCTHRRQCDDIGTVKIPNMLKKHTGRHLVIETCSGSSFPTDLSPYAMVIHCGGCTLHEKEMKHRLFIAKEQNVPIVNYGIFIAYMNGIVQRSTKLFK